MEPADEWSVLLGVHSQDGPLEGAHVRTVAAILVPVNYSTVELGSDLALLRLASPATLGPSVQPVCLPRSSHLFAHGTSCWATGWGDVQEAGEWGADPPIPPLPLQVLAAGGALKAESSGGWPPWKLGLKGGRNPGGIWEI